MGSLRILALVLLAAGALGLAYGGFSYVKATHKVDMGPLHMQLNETDTVNVPVWLSAAAVIAGVALLATSGKR